MQGYLCLILGKGDFCLVLPVSLPLATQAKRVDPCSLVPGMDHLAASDGLQACFLPSLHLSLYVSFPFCLLGTGSQYTIWASLEHAL